MKLIFNKELTKLILTLIFYTVSTTLLAGCWINSTTYKPINISFDGSPSPQHNYLQISSNGYIAIRTYCDTQEESDIELQLSATKKFELTSSKLISHDGTTQHDGRFEPNQNQGREYSIYFDGVDCRDLNNYKLLLGPIDMMGYPPLEVPLIQFKIETTNTERNIVSPLFLLLGH